MSCLIAHDAAAADNDDDDDDDDHDDDDDDDDHDDPSSSSSSSSSCTLVSIINNVGNFKSPSKIKHGNKYFKKCIHGKSVQFSNLKSTERVPIYPYPLHMEVFVCWNIKNLDFRSEYISHNLLFNWYIQSEQKFIALSTICI